MHRVRPSPMRRTRCAALIAPLCVDVVGVPNSHGLRTDVDVTAAKDRSVWTPRRPVVWPRWQVSWLAGRCSGASGLPGCPVALYDASSPLTVAGAAADCCKIAQFPRSLFRPRVFGPGNQHVEMFPLPAGRVKRRRARAPVTASGPVQIY